MNMIINKIIDYVDQHIVVQCLNFIAMLTFAASLIMLTASCSEVDGGAVQNTVELPIDSSLNLYCEDEGIYLERCVLDNPQNPYANVAVTEDNKFALQDAAPSAKSRYYLWATALAKGAGLQGENQYYTALSLHEIYAESGSPTTQEQAKRAYRSILDNFFLSATFFVQTLPSGDVTYAVAVKDLVGANLYNPTLSTIISLYTDQILALVDMSEWGYIYDTTNLVTNKRD